MLLGGLWHGASWNFVLWGFLHGIYLAVHRVLRIFRPQQAKTKGGPVFVLGAGVFTFFLVTLTWIPFRCVAFADTVTCLQRIFTWAPMSGNAPVIDSGQLVMCWLLVGLVLFFDVFYKCEFIYWQDKRWTAWVKSLLPAIFVILTIIFGATEAQQFIYFQF
jgi:D-alanyl-lipoteichoic acid acyltransferase DltB (MBOAT superfamily)